MQEKSNSNQPMSEKWYWRLLDGFFLNQNSTFDILLKLTVLIVMAWLLLAEAREWRKSFVGTNGSIVNGCVLPAYLLINKQLPKLPPAPEGELTVAQEREWLQDAFDTYQTWGVDMVADRKDIVKLCRL